MKERMNIAIYPGSFDPVTNGHLYILKHTKDMFKSVICTVMTNTKKTPLFTLEEKLDMLRNTVPKCVKADYFGGLLADYAKRIKAQEKADKITIIRGVRLNTDFEYELLMAFNNKKLEPGLGYIFIPTDQELIHINSSIVRDISTLGPHYIDTLDVPKYVKEKMKEKFSKP